MSTIDNSFVSLLNNILNNGREYENKRRATTRLQIPSYTLRHDFKDGFPAIGVKELPFDQVVTELIWFLRGDTNIKYLLQNGCNIWNKDAYNWYVKKCKDCGYPIRLSSVKEFISVVKSYYFNGGKINHFELPLDYTLGDVGKNYSYQWRNFGGLGVDQIYALITNMIKDPMESRLKVNAWNPAQLGDTALPPCHSEFQAIGVPLTSFERIEYARDVYGKEFSMSEDVMSILDEAKVPRYGFELHWIQR